MTADNQQKLSLRERKKVKTRAIIQQNALRLIREQGYASTTVEQIAEASEISPSTFFRYFKTKESVILDDDFDPILIQLFKQQPKELNIIQAFRASIKLGFAQIPSDEKEALRERMEFIMSVPELRVASFNQVTDTAQMIAQLIADRVGRNIDDIEVFTSSGIIMGAIISAAAYSFKHPEKDMVHSIDEALATLESGIPF